MLSWIAINCENLCRIDHGMTTRQQRHDVPYCSGAMSYRLAQSLAAGNESSVLLRRMQLVGQAMQGCPVLLLCLRPYAVCITLMGAVRLM